MRGLLQHLLITFRLNFRSRQALVYGYLVPVFFLIAFGSVFRAGVPPLTRELGQLLTITILGGACFGMPTAMVAERERGVWRRYRLLPAGVGGLVASTMIARIFIIAGAAILQIALAMWIYGMPAPNHVVQLVLAYVVVCFAFLGMGLVIAMLAETVAAVQALGQSIFLPMIMIGGVGVPLRVLPAWAQHVAAFLPGIYAVRATQACIDGAGLGAARWDLLALLVIGLAAGIGGSKMFRWDAGQKLAPEAKAWVLAALASWAVVGVVALYVGRPASAGAAPGSIISSLSGPTAAAPSTSSVVATASSEPYESITAEQIAGITYDDLQDDSGSVTPLAVNLDHLDAAGRQWMDQFQTKLDAWPPGKIPDLGQRVRNLLSVAAVADLAEHPYEGDIAYVVLNQLKRDVPRPTLEKVLAWVILNPDAGQVLTSLPELGIPDRQREEPVRGRSVEYAEKLLGRLLGKLPAQSQGQ